MVQPKTPPLSVRLPPWLLEHIKAQAVANGVKVNAELVAVLTRAYRLGEKAADMGATPEQVMKAARPEPKPPASPPKVSVSLPLATNAPAPFGSRLKKPRGSPK